MKKVLPILLALFLFSGCEKESFDTDELIGSWKLIETLADPGDGSGTFRPYDGNQVLDFHRDSTISYTEPLCSNEITVEMRFDTSTIFGDECSYSYSYELKDGYLYLYQPCIEPCALKFEKIAD